MQHHPIQPLVQDPHGVTRFKENAIVRHVLEFARTRGCGLNELSVIEFSDEDRQQFAQLIGYSLSGYGDLSYVSNEAFAAAEACACAPADQLAVRNNALRDELQRVRLAVSGAIDALQEIGEPEIG